MRTKTIYVQQNLSVVFSVLIVAGLAAVNCGKQSKSNGSAPASRSELEKAFLKAGQEYGIPDRFLMGVAFLESNLNGEEASAPYYQLEGDSKKHTLGFGSTETAFGLSRETLGLKNGEEGDSLEVQVNKYALWLKEKLAEQKNLKLPQSPSNLDQRFEWLWEIGKIHHPEDRNIRVIWVRSFMNLLNAGRMWQDPKKGESLKLAPEGEPFVDEKLSPQAQALLRFDDDISDVRAARRLDLVGAGGTSLENFPRQVEVIHCPLNLAACLALQDTTIESRVRLGAHYLIPQDSSIVPRPIQILDHERRVQMTSSDGTIKDVKDTVVVMLVGNSGRYVAGKRTNADPTWFTPWQLRKLGSVIKGICRSLAERNSSVEYGKCIDPESREGISFRSQGNRITYRWGDIPDYDKSIFWAYINSKDADIQGEILLETPGNRVDFRAGEELELRSKFTAGVKWIRLQRAVRCNDDQLVWDTMRTDPIRTETSWPMRISIWDAGPNSNGRQFLRVLAYGEKNELLGWQIADFFVKDFDLDFNPPSEACFFRDQLN